MRNSDSQPLFDRAIIEELRELIGDDVHELITLFGEIGPALAARISNASASQNIEEITIAAHTLKSNSAQLGALRLSEMCRELEALSHDGYHQEFAQRASAIHAEVQSVIAALQQIGK